MKCKILLLLSALLTIDASAQTQTFSFPTDSVYKPGSFVIKGKIKNAKDTIIDFGLTDFIGTKTNSLIIRADGKFEQQFPIRWRQDAFFFNDSDTTAFMFSFLDKDTIYVEWDKNDFKNSFFIKGKNAEQTAQLQEQLRLAKNFNKPYLNLQILLSENQKTFDDDKKFNLINDLYNRHVHAILDTLKDFKENEVYLITSLYFMYSNLLRSFDLMPHYELQLRLDSSKTYPFFNMAGISWNYEYLNEYWFYNVPQYRDFIFDYIRFVHPFNYPVPVPNNNKPETSNFTQNEYYLARSLLYIKSIQEWFITNSIISGFNYYDFAGVEKVYEQFIPACEDSFLKDTLQQFYTAMKRLKPGNTAPGFSLKNEQGKTISLSDFKGKVVYIDFWASWCGPCVGDIKNYVPALHQKYKDKNVVFVNISVDDNENDWKKALNKYQLDGINLLAEDWVKNPVCKAYNINAVPHYILVDKNGMIANNNAPGASELNTHPTPNELDLLLK